MEGRTLPCGQEVARATGIKTGHRFKNSLRSMGMPNTQPKGQSSIKAISRGALPVCVRNAETHGRTLWRCCGKNPKAERSRLVQRLQVVCKDVLKFIQVVALWRGVITLADRARLEVVGTQIFRH